MERATTVLITAPPEDIEGIAELLEGEEELSLLHLPLEIYEPVGGPDPPDGLEAALGRVENIIYGRKRNARFLLRSVRQRGLLRRVKELLNLAADRRTACYLEDEGIPAVYPGSDTPIDLVEFMLRFWRTGPALYPCGKNEQEEIPGLLQELDIPVREYELYRRAAPSSDALDQYRQQIGERPPDLIVCHSRRSVNRLRAAFPDLDLERAGIIAGNRGVAGKLKDLKLSADYVAAGTWESIHGKVKQGVRAL
ncbi:MAG: uroporphyrinogen-III synthase [Balneolaceae bacterium]|nr:uroporphyrinogen-III synthase [Balneolaceae bacterium]